MDASFANKAMIFLIWLMALTFFRSAWVEAGCSNEQNRALLEIRNSTHGLAFADFDGSHCSSCCRAHGIRCNADGKVTSIYLRMQSAPSTTWYPNVTSFILFDELEVLGLINMNIGGKLQPFCELRRLKNLRRLNLWNNTLEGNIPSCLGMLENLELLDLSLNFFHGNLPSSIFSNQSKIEWFLVRDNKLEGVLPFSIFANASRLKYLQLSRNAWEVDTESPSWVPTFQLTDLFMTNYSLNKKNGNVVPSFISNQSLLNVLDLSGNSLEGSIPCHLFFNMHIRVLFLSGNKIEGSFLDCSANGTSSLEWLDISHNYVNGSLPETIGHLLPRLRYVRISSNAIEGNIPRSFGKMPLEVLDLSSNMLSGTIPRSLTRNGTLLEFLDLSNNKLLGEMLPRDSNMTMLKFLHLSGNHLRGVISPTISNSPSLAILDIRGNDLSGNIPKWLYDHPRLVAVLLSGNHFEGHLSRRMCRMERLQVFDVSHNRLSGGIPSCIDNITFWKQRSPSPTYSNYFTENGRINYVFQENDIMKFGFDRQILMSLVIKNRVYNFTGLPLLLMTGIDLSSNQLTGSIPSEMGELSQLQFLNLSSNSLTGSLPISFGKLRSMESLDLSHNKLRGRIPSELVGLTSLSIFSVACNNLSGRIPLERQFSTFTSQCYEGNPKLCGNPLPRNCSTANQLEPEHKEQQKDEKEGNRMIDHPNFFFYAFVTMSYALGFWAFFGILIIKKNWRHKYFNAVDGYIESLFELFSKYR
ncbi:hypothetical protein F2P56_029354 [Juglans regia]|uniref:Uncharacterized protein n=2 Tax=Juglans regia TaxID=51240 RepID=A0A833TYK8_JUGRE|nr:receptor-like protein 56 [Juglans regia]KAF5448857.1 hypothetical protein F2P56_029354 [Juglans regia]